MSQTLFKIEVLPAFALPMTSTLNWTFGSLGGADSRRLVLCFTPIARKCVVRKKDWARSWPHVGICSLLLYGQDKHQLTGVHAEACRFISRIDRI